MEVNLTLNTNELFKIDEALTAMKIDLLKRLDINEPGEYGMRWNEYLKVSTLSDKVWAILKAEILEDN